MKNRSPLLGYNHNIRYSGRLFHVQTEDSGINNPHLFTHLFHAGTILASKRTDYSASDDEGSVQKTMQAQHKAMLKELRAGAFDVRIGQFFGEPVTHGDAAPAPHLAAADEDERTAPSPRVSAAALGLATHEPSAPSALGDRTDPDPIPLAAASPRPDAASPFSALPDIDIDMDEASMPDSPFGPPRAPSAAPLPAPPPIGLGPPSPRAPTPLLTPLQSPTTAPVRPPARPAPRPIAEPAPYVSPPRTAFDLPPPPQANPAPPRAAPRPTMVFGSGVVAPRRPMGPPSAAPPLPSVSPSAFAAAPSSFGGGGRAPDTIFGEDMEKSLDEVILAYLAEDPPEK